jgi:phage repressor protein C with HTH and peptisase S24 domain
MYPLLKPGDIIAYKILNSLNLLIYGEIYLVQLVHDGDIQIVVKYVKRSPRGTDYVSLVSLNKDYDPLEVPLTWIHLIARVSFAIRRFTF